MRWNILSVKSARGITEASVFSMVQIGYEPELCFVSISGLSNWQPINKEQFFKEIG
jgi:hypothetical protein